MRLETVNLPFLAVANPTDGNIWGSRSGQSFRANHQVGYQHAGRQAHANARLQTPGCNSLEPTCLIVWQQVLPELVRCNVRPLLCRAPAEGRH